MAAPYVDVAELALYSFFGFFLALVFYQIGRASCRERVCSTV